MYLEDLLVVLVTHTSVGTTMTTTVRHLPGLQSREDGGAGRRSVLGAGHITGGKRAAMSAIDDDKPPVGIAINSPLLGLGITEALSGWNLPVNRVSDTDRWWMCHPDGVLVMEASRSEDLDRIADLTARRPVRVVALVEQASAAAALAAVNAGALGVISADWSTDAVRMAVAAVAAGLTLVSTDVFLSLATGRGPSGDDPPTGMTDVEIVCLRALARGDKVREIAELVGYSEREVYRRLRRLYQRLGVTGRTEAVLRASRMGLLESQAS